MKKSSLVLAAVLAVCGASAFAQGASGIGAASSTPMLSNSLDSNPGTCLNCSSSTTTLGAGPATVTTTTTTSRPVVTSQTMFLTVGPGSFHGAVPGDYASNMAFNRWMSLK